MAGHLGLRRRLSAGSDGRAAFLPHSWRSFHDIGIAAFAGARFPARSRGVDVMKAYAEVIGDPVAHSRSPFIHNFWLGELGIDAEYWTCRVEAGKVGAYLSERRADRSDERRVGKACGRTCRLRWSP